MPDGRTATTPPYDPRDPRQDVICACGITAVYACETRACARVDRLHDACDDLLAIKVPKDVVAPLRAYADSLPGVRSGN